MVMNNMVLSTKTVRHTAPEIFHCQGHTNVETSPVSLRLELCCKCNSWVWDAAANVNAPKLNRKRNMTPRTCMNAFVPDGKLPTIQVPRHAREPLARKPPVNSVPRNWNFCPRCAQMDLERWNSVTSVS